VKVLFQINETYGEPRLKIIDRHGKWVGNIGFGVGSKKSEGYPIGYGLNKEYRGRGIMAKAIKLLMEHSTREIFQACVYSDNYASIRTLENAGFKQISVHEEYTATEVLVFEYKKSDYKVLTQSADKENYGHAGAA
jgi:RimJ/RimL family protein N-acetyltransferase